MRFTITISVIAVSLVSIACGGSEDTSSTVQPTQTSADSEVQRLETMARRFAPVDLTADVTALPENERRALAKMVDAAKTFDALFLRQVWEGNETENDPVKLFQSCKPVVLTGMSTPSEVVAP